MLDLVPHRRGPLTKDALGTAARALACYQRVDGVLVAPVGHLWAAFSPASGETSLLNDETAAILEVLQAGPSDSRAIAQALADDCDLAPSELCDMIDAGWHRLLDAGLVQALQTPASALGESQAPVLLPA